MAHFPRSGESDAGRSGGAAVSSPAAPTEQRWFRFLSRWSLFAGLAVLGIFLAFGLGVIPASQGSSLPREYSELAAAINGPAAYRLFVILDIAVWLSLGGFFVALAAILIPRHPVRGAFIAACGIGQVVGMNGAFMRLYGTRELATRYIEATPEQREIVLGAYLDLQQIVVSHFGAGALLWRVALVLAASAVLSTPGFPRWLAGLIALPGAIGLTQMVLEFVTGEHFFFLFFPQLLLLMIVFFAIAWLFRRRAPEAGEGNALVQPNAQSVS